MKSTVHRLEQKRMLLNNMLNRTALQIEMKFTQVVQNIIKNVYKISFQLG
jgi:hypothetical protein